MRQTYASKSATIIDNGLFVELAVTLAKSFGEVRYWTPWESPFPRSNQRLIGTGLEGVTRVQSFWEYLDDTDLWVFPDVCFGSLQMHLADDLGLRVWGSRLGENLEQDRVKSKEHMQSLGMPVGVYEVVRGIDNLRLYLKGRNDQWVKVSTTRGDFESFHSPNYKLIEPRLDELEHRLGAKKRIMEFVVEDGIGSNGDENGKAVEIGFDGYTVDGVFPKRNMVGIEVKDKGYVGHCVGWEMMPTQLRVLNETIAPTLRRCQYRNFFCMEARITEDGTPWIIDPCCRSGSPPFELTQLNMTNLADVLWYGAGGECIEPEFAHEWGAEMLLHSGWADQNWQAVQFPEEVRDHVKLRNLCRIGEAYYVVPQSVGLPEIGAVVATGDTMEEAIARCREITETVEGYYIDAFPNALDDAQQEVEKLAEFGIRL